LSHGQRLITVCGCAYGNDSAGNGNSVSSPNGGQSTRAARRQVRHNAGGDFKWRVRPDRRSQMRWVVHPFTSGAR
ncbi:hypothetical protein, partial [Rhodococcus koreensis]